MTVNDIIGVNEVLVEIREKMPPFYRNHAISATTYRASRSLRGASNVRAFKQLRITRLIDISFFVSTCDCTG